MVVYQQRAETGFRGWWRKTAVGNTLTYAWRTKIVNPWVDFWYTWNKTLGRGRPTGTDVRPRGMPGTPQAFLPQGARRWFEFSLTQPPTGITGTAGPLAPGQVQFYQIQRPNIFQWVYNRVVGRYQAAQTLQAGQAFTTAGMPAPGWTQNQGVMQQWWIAQSFPTFKSWLQGGVQKDPDPPDSFDGIFLDGIGITHGTDEKTIKANISSWMGDAHGRAWAFRLFKEHAVKRFMRNGWQSVSGSVLKQALRDYTYESTDVSPYVERFDPATGTVRLEEIQETDDRGNLRIYALEELSGEQLLKLYNYSLGKTMLGDREDVNEEMFRNWVEARYISGRSFKDTKAESYRVNKIKDAQKQWKERALNTILGEFAPQGVAQYRRALERQVELALNDVYYDGNAPPFFQQIVARLRDLKFEYDSSVQEIEGEAARREVLEEGRAAGEGFEETLRQQVHIPGQGFTTSFGSRQPGYGQIVGLSKSQKALARNSLGVVTHRFEARLAPGGEANQAAPLDRKWWPTLQPMYYEKVATWLTTPRIVDMIYHYGQQGMDLKRMFKVERQLFKSEMSKLAREGIFDDPDDICRNAAIRFGVPYMLSSFRLNMHSWFGGGGAPTYQGEIFDDMRRAVDEVAEVLENQLPQYVIEGYNGTTPEAVMSRLRKRYWMMVTALRLLEQSEKDGKYNQLTYDSLVKQIYIPKTESDLNKRMNELFPHDHDKREAAKSFYINEIAHGRNFTDVNTGIEKDKMIGNLMLLAAQYKPFLKVLTANMPQMKRMMDQLDQDLQAAA